MYTGKLIKYCGVVAFAILSGCTMGKSGNQTTVLGSVGGSQTMQPKISITISNGSSTLYSDSVVNSSLVLKATENYNLHLQVSDAPIGTSYALEVTQIDVVNGATQSLPLVVGDNTLSLPSQGDYSWKLVASAASYTPVTKQYQAQVTCALPTFTAGSLNGAGISVTSGSGSNLYGFSAAGVVSGANGLPPYQCAFDPTGTGIVDTVFHPCSQTLQDVYVNYVNSRNVGVIVKDSCNTTYSISHDVQLDYTEPAMPGNVFVFGQVSGATGSAVGDSRVDGVTYLATNSGGNNIVQPMYGNGNFGIYSVMNYQMSSSVKFGMEIELKGLVDNINVATGMGAVSATNATISSVAYATDQAGDEQPAVRFTGVNCQLSNQGATVKFLQGQPCSAGTTGDNNMATVEVWGHYSCTSLSSVGGSITINGDFDGSYNLVDHCGGGGGGGGIVPIRL